MAALEGRIAALESFLSESKTSLNCEQVAKIDPIEPNGHLIRALGSADMERLSGQSPTSNNGTSVRIHASRGMGISLYVLIILRLRLMFF